MLFDAFVERTFDVEIFDDGFDDQIAVFEFREIVVEVADRDECSIVRREEGRGLGVFRGFETTPSDAIANLGTLEGQSFGLFIGRQLARWYIEE